MKNKEIYELSDFSHSEQIILKSAEDDFEMNCVVGFTKHAMFDRMFSVLNKERNRDIYLILDLIKSKADKIFDLEMADGRDVFAILSEDKKMGLIFRIGQEKNTLFMRICTVISIKKEISNGVYTYREIHVDKKTLKAII